MQKTILFFIIINLIILETYAQTSKIDSLENLLQNHKAEDIIRVNLLTKTARSLMYNDVQKALQYAEEARDISSKINYKYGLAQSYYYIGISVDLMGDYSTSLKHYDKALSVFVELKNKNGQSSVMMAIGNIYITIGNFNNALEYTQKALVIMTEIEDKKGISYCLNNIGIIYENKSNYPKSLEYYHKSMKISEELNDDVGVSYCLNNIAVIYFKQKDYEQADEYYKKTLVFYEKLNDKFGIGLCYNGLGAISRKQGKNSDALNYYQKVIVIANEMNDKFTLAECFSNIGRVYLHQEKYSQAFEFYEKSLEIEIEIENKSGICKSYMDIAEIYLKQKKYSLALENAIKSIKIAEELGMLKEQQDTRKILSEIYAQTKNFEKAYENQLLYKKLNDSLFNENNIKKITNLQNQYEFDKEKQAIEIEQQKKDAIKEEKAKQQKNIRNLFIGAFALMAILSLVIFRSFIQKRKANNILAQQKEEIELQAESLVEKNEQLEELSNFKEGLTGMIIHDLKNPISTIINLSKNNEVVSTSQHMLNMVSNILDVQKYEETQMVLDTKSYSLYKISNNALLQVKLLAEQKNIKLQNNITSNRFIDTDQEITSRIFTNLLTNAIKYTPENGTITITCEKDTDNPNFANIKITDNGIGIDKDKLDSVFDKFTQVIAKKSGQVRSTGLGLTFCKIATEAHGGKINVTSIPNKETTFSFTLPFANKTLLEDKNIIIDKEIDELQLNEKENLIIIDKKITELQLNEKEKIYLQQFITEYKKYDIYDIMPLRKITDEIDDDFSENIKKWKEKMQKIVYNINESEYNSLLL